MAGMMSPMCKPAALQLKVWSGFSHSVARIGDRGSPAKVIT
jgi:hypothetical protein